MLTKRIFIMKQNYDFLWKTTQQSIRYMTQYLWLHAKGHWIEESGFSTSSYQHCQYPSPIKMLNNELIDLFWLRVLICCCVKIWCPEIAIYFTTVYLHAYILRTLHVSSGFIMKGHYGIRKFQVGSMSMFFY